MDKLELVKNFAASIDNAIGTEETTQLLTALTQFAKDCPDALQEIRQLVVENPEVFDKMLTREGVADAKLMIAQVAQYAPLIAQMQ
ncbi:hypothetical protein [Dyadobacter aurulentus]|uniref:hypothetical protein n=1 Tax=Dyadobacter sp. UC 10 TaxID=2605428 RepID=UPI0011F392BC|nr:hypothetical protein [Dyadobacter sp. UC 10]KAA0992772.1 hypothetical protein FXO21_22635 [Dyadobacter sp. UC 10]